MEHAVSKYIAIVCRKGTRRMPDCVVFDMNLCRVGETADLGFSLLSANDSCLLSEMEPSDTNISRLTAVVENTQTPKTRCKRRRASR